MAGSRKFDKPGGPHKPFVLPPDLDMGSLKLDDLDFDLEREVARLRAEDSARSAPARPAPRP